MTFLESLLYLGKRLTPIPLLGLFFAVQDTINQPEEEGAGLLHFVAFIIACVAATWGEHWLLEEYVFQNP